MEIPDVNKPTFERLLVSSGVDEKRKAELRTEFASAVPERVNAAVRELINVKAGKQVPSAKPGKIPDTM